MPFWLWSSTVTPRVRPATRSGCPVATRCDTTVLVTMPPAQSANSSVFGDPVISSTASMAASTEPA